MVALEFVKPGVADGRTPDPEMAKRVIAEALARHLIVLSAGSWGQVVRIIPPLVTTEAEVAHALSVLREALQAAGA
jgi:4-aminobutyrate aminotransferase-like enzyme